MTKKSPSKANGGLSAGTIEPRQGTPSSGAGLTPLAKSPTMSDTLVFTAPQNPNFPHTPNSQKMPPNVVWGKIIQTFAAKLCALGALEWRSWELADGRRGWGLFFDNSKWLVDPLTKELTPTNAESK